MKITTNYLKTFYRALKRSPMYTSVNIMGLAIGLAASLIIYLWVYDEISFDRFHENSHRIYRIERDLIVDDNQMLVPITSPPTAPQMTADYAQVEAFTRLVREEVLIEDKRMLQNKEPLFYADSSFFDVFSFALLKGNPSTCLTEPFSVVLSESAARKYLGENPQTGSTLRITINEQQYPFIVRAIFKDFPSNSHIQADIIASFSSLKSLRHEMMMTSWMASFLYSYILLSEQAEADILEENLQEMVDLYFGDDIRNFLKVDNPRDFLKIRLMPLTDIHLNGNRTWELESPGSKNSVTVFSLVSVLLLVIAGINFMNLSTARATRRAREVGVRKVSGATRQQLIIQFLLESVLFSFIALILALLIMELALPSFSAFTGKDLSLNLLLTPGNLALIVAAWLFTAFASGLYPAFFLSSFQPIEVLKGKPGTGGGQRLRKMLVAGQFVISITLIVCAVTAYQHLQYLNNKNLGYHRHGLIDIPIEDRSLFKSYPALKHDILSLPYVENITRSMVIPTASSFIDNPFMLRTKPDLYFPILNHADENFLSVLKTGFIAGENFSAEMVRDSDYYYVINEAASRMFGFSTPFEALGEEIALFSSTEGEENNWGPIVGVFENFHFQALTEPLKPMVIIADNNRHNHITIRVDQDHTEQAEDELQEIWQQHFPSMMFNSQRIAHNFDEQHLTERRLQAVLLLFTFLSIFVACLGLLGLSAFATQQRIKEIGIRKTLGARMHQIILLISADFSKLVLIAGFIALPAAYLIMEQWLSNFPYRRDMQIWVFVLALAAAWLASMITVFINAYGAAKVNPVDSLQHE